MNDFQAPFDPTAYASVTGAQLLQLVSGLTPANSRGIVVITTDIASVAQIPDANTYVYYQSYIWIRVQAATASCYVWSPGSVNNGAGAGFLHWIPVSNSIAYGSIIGAMIAPATITADRIISLDYSQLTNIPVNLPPTGAAGGALAGTYPSPTLSPNAIVDAQVAAQGLTPTIVLKGSGTDQQMLRSKIGTPSQLEFFNCPSIVKSASGVNSNAGTDNKVPMVTVGSGADAGSWAMKNISDLLVNIQAADITAIINALSAANATTIAGKFAAVDGQTILALNEGFYNMGALTLSFRGTYVIPAGFAPKFFNAYLLCLATGVDGDFHAGDLIDIKHVTGLSGATVVYPSIVRTGAKLTVNMAGSTSFKATDTLGNAISPLTVANWSVYITWMF